MGEPWVPYQCRKISCFLSILFCPQLSHLDLPPLLLQGCPKRWPTMPSTIHMIYVFKNAFPHRWNFIFLCNSVSRGGHAIFHPTLVPLFHRISISAGAWGTPAIRPIQLLCLFHITGAWQNLSVSQEKKKRIWQTLLKITFFLFKKIGQNLSVRVMRNKDNNWNGLNFMLPIKYVPHQGWKMVVLTGHNF